MILNVPYYSQLEDIKNPDWKRKSCGIVCLKMVLDYYQPTDLSIDDLFQKGLEIGGYKENEGWYHHSLAILAQQLGFKAITRSWNIPEDKLKKLQKRGFREEDIDILRRQQLDEAIYTLKKELEDKHPIIIPVPKGFIQGGSGHLMVLVGFDEKNLYFNDPYGERDKQPVKIPYQQFMNIFSRRAIFIEKK